MPPLRQLLLAGAAVAAATAPPPAPETGPHVGSFEMRPAASALGAYHNSSLNSWGGALLHVEDDKTWPYHMFASGFVEGCGLHAWETNSEIIHLVSADLRKPFVLSDVALPPWHHGVGAARAPDGTFLLFTMGKTNTSNVVPCPGGIPRWPSSQNCTKPACTGFDVRGHSAPSAYGPWTPIHNIAPNSKYFGTEVLWNAVNPDPSPFILPNGTVVVVGGGLYAAAHWKGPYLPVPGPRFTQNKTLGTDPRLHGGHAAAEDAYLWYQDGHWRQMWHQKIDSPTDHVGDHNQCQYFPYVGGYAVAKTPGFDGLRGEWQHNFFQPGFGLNVSLANGSSFCLSRRERPKLAEIEGKLWLTNGVMADGIAGDGPADRGTYTFLQEVVSIPNLTTTFNRSVRLKTDDPRVVRSTATDLPHVPVAAVAWEPNHVA